MAKLTIRDLRNAIMQVNVMDWDKELRVVYHGYNHPSFNLPVSLIQEGPNFDFQLIVKEPRNG